MRGRLPPSSPPLPRFRLCFTDFMIFHSTVKVSYKLFKAALYVDGQYEYTSATMEVLLQITMVVFLI